MGKIKLAVGRQLMAQLQQLVYGRFVGNGHSLGCLWRHEIKSASNVRLHVLAMDHRVQHSVLHEKFAGLEAFRQFLADGLLNHARPAKPMSAPGSAMFRSPNIA